MRLLHIGRGCRDERNVRSHGESPAGEPAARPSASSTSFRPARHVQGVENDITMVHFRWKALKACRRNIILKNKMACWKLGNHINIKQFLIAWVAIHQSHRDVTSWKRQKRNKAGEIWKILSHFTWFHSSFDFPLGTFYFEQVNAISFAGCIILDWIEIIFYTEALTLAGKSSFVRNCRRLKRLMWVITKMQCACPVVPILILNLRSSLGSCSSGMCIIQSFLTD